MDDRRTQRRRQEDEQMHIENCYFREVQGKYDGLIAQQEQQNALVMDLLSKLNDNLQEYKEGSDEQLLQLIDQIKIQVNGMIGQIVESDKRDKDHDRQFKEVFVGIEELRAYVNMQSEDIGKASAKISELKSHMDNGWKKDLLADMKSMMDDLRKQNHELMNVIVQKSATQNELDNERDKRSHDLKMRRQDSIFKLLIGATASGGLILAFIQMLSGK